MSEAVYGIGTKAWQCVVGCDESLPCAANCWAKGQVHRLAFAPNQDIREAHAGLVEKVDWVTCAAGEQARHEQRLRWTGTVRLNEAHLEDPLRWKKPQLVCVGYHADWALVEWLAWDKVFKVMQSTPRHLYFTLTKRPQMLAKRLLERSPCNHILIGASASDQGQLNARMPALMKLAAAGWRISLSLEPLLGPVNLKAWRHYLCFVIVGGESGPGARPMHPDWARSLRDQCAAAGLPFNFKQRGEFTWDLPSWARQLWSGAFWLSTSGMGEVYVYRVGKRAAGRLLDGVLHDALPEVKR